MELGNIADTFGDFEAAIAENADDPDIYYHRAQVYFIAGELDKALDDYSKSSEIDPSFIFSHVQKAVTLYRQGKVAPSMAEFRRILKQFPDRSEPYNYYGELLLAENRFADALEKFDKAVEIEAKKGGRQNVLPMVNKANTVLREHNDLAGCERLVKEALEIDPDCDVAIITLAQLSLQQSKIEQAVTMFGRAREIARTEDELVQAVRRSPSLFCFLGLLNFLTDAFFCDRSADHVRACHPSAGQVHGVVPRGPRKVQRHDERHGRPAVK